LRIEQGDHVIFVWHTRTSDYVIGLHAWEPSRKRWARCVRSSNRARPRCR